MLKSFVSGVPRTSRGSFFTRKTLKRRFRHTRLFQFHATTEEADFKLESNYTEPDGVDYYSVLGVSPNADAKVIKKAYHKAMRDYHPDISMDDDATEFCIFLNEVYETLMDPEKRAAYDGIAGFQYNAVNPFYDDSYPANQVFVDEFTCIGCQNCINVCPKSFGLEEMFGRARVINQNYTNGELVQEAIDTCPVSCIHWVTAPQLTLLETAMAKIERVSAYILLMGCSAGTDVFQEAIRSFEKRQQEIRSRREAAEQASWMNDIGFDIHHNNDSDGSYSPDYDIKKQATAAQAAASARRWRDYQRNMRDRDTLRLPSSTSN
eukprot:g5322.t2